MPLMDVLAKMQVKRGLISTHYGHLTKQSQMANSGLARRGWEKDLGKMTDETWQCILKHLQTVSVSPQQYLT